MAPILFLIVAFSCTVGAIALSMLHIYRHLLNYMEPTFQRYIIRIIFMVPVYALMSFSSLIRTERSICFSTMREIYESWAISNFLLLCLAWVGGRVAVVEFNGQSLKPSWYLMTCCFLAIPLDGRFIRRCMQGVLQFVILNRIFVNITFIIFANEKYEDGNFSVDQAYLYITIMLSLWFTSHVKICSGLLTLCQSSS